MFCGNKFYLTIVLLVGASLASAANDELLHRQRRGFFSSFEDAKTWFTEKVAVPFRDNVYQPVSTWVSAKWTEHKPTIEQQFQRALGKIDEYLGNGTVDKIKTKSNESYQQLLALNTRVVNYLRSITSDSGFMKNTTAQLSQLDDMFKKSSKVVSQPLMVASDDQRVVKTDNNDDAEEVEEDDEQVSEEEKKRLSDELHNNLLQLRTSLTAYSRKMAAEQQDAK